MKNENKHNIDSFIKNKLEDYKSPVADDLWANIEKEIGSDDPPPGMFFRGRYLLLLGLAMFMVFTAVMAILSLKQQEQPIASTPDPVHHIAPHEQQNEDISAAELDDNLLADSPIGPFTQTPPGADRAGQDRTSTRIETPVNNTTPTSGRLTAGTPPSTENGTATNPTANNAENPIATNIHGDPNDTKPIVDRIANAENPLLPTEDVVDDPVSSMIDTSSELTAELPILPIPAVPVPFNLQVFTGTAMPVAFFSGADSDSRSLHRSQVNAAMSGQNLYNFSIFSEQKVTEKLRFRPGIQVSASRENLNHNWSLTETIIREDSTTGHVIIPGQPPVPVTIYFMDTVDVTQDYSLNTKNRHTLINVPIHATYRFKEGNISLYGLSGFNFTLLQKNNGHYISPNNNAAVEINDGNYRLQSFTGFTIGAGSEFNMGRGLIYAIEPKVTFYPGNLYGNSTLQRRNLYFQLSTGIIFRNK